MAGKAIITEELVCKAAEQLAAEGIRPTNETVRELLAKWTSTKGGSYVTITPVLRAWKARRKTAELTDQLVSLQADIARLSQQVVDLERELAARKKRPAMRLGDRRTRRAAQSSHQSRSDHPGLHRKEG